MKSYFFSYDDKGNLEEYSQSISTGLIEIIARLAAIGGVATIVFSFIAKDTPYLLQYGIISIVTSCFLRILSNISDDIHHMHYLMVLFDQEESKRRLRDLDHQSSSQNNMDSTEDNGDDEDVEADEAKEGVEDDEDEETDDFFKVKDKGDQQV